MAIVWLNDISIAWKLLAQENKLFMSVCLRSDNLIAFNRFVKAVQEEIRFNRRGSFSGNF